MKLPRQGKASGVDGGLLEQYPLPVIIISTARRQRGKEEYPYAENS